MLKTLKKNKDNMPFFGVRWCQVVSGGVRWCQVVSGNNTMNPQPGKVHFNTVSGWCQAVSDGVRWCQVTPK
jgi:hypothetical protein